jgi:hypothetical protein
LPRGKFEPGFTFSKRIESALAKRHHIASRLS